MIYQFRCRAQSVPDHSLTIQHSCGSTFYLLTASAIAPHSRFSDPIPSATVLTSFPASQSPTYLRPILQFLQNLRSRVRFPIELASTSYLSTPTTEEVVDDPEETTKASDAKVGLRRLTYRPTKLYQTFCGQYLTRGASRSANLRHKIGSATPLSGVLRQTSTCVLPPFSRGPSRYGLGMTWVANWHPSSKDSRIRDL